jgi:predicted metal-binding membrane protein
MDLPLRDRAAFLLALTGLAAISWLYLCLQLSPMDGMAMPVAFSPWTAADFALNVAIWWVMMPGMMLPSTAPMILTFATVNRRKRTRGRPFVPTAVFTTGYLIAWGLFGIAAALADLGARADRADVADDAEADPGAGRSRDHRRRRLPVDAL